MYCVYRHISPNGKIYVGITSQKPENRWQAGNGYRGNLYFSRAIKKYGWENFKHEIIKENIPEKQAKEIEIELIKKYRSNERKFGYNISSGGESKSGTKISDWQKERIRQGNLNKVVSFETREKLRKASKKYWQNEEHIEHMRAINKGKNNPAYGKHMTDAEKIKRKAKSVIQYTIDGKEINKFISIHDANMKTKINRNDISKCCKGIFKQAGGYIWKYAETRNL